MISQGKIIKYTFCHENHSSETAIWFYCSKCKKLTDVEIEALLPVVPKGYTEKTCNITITITITEISKACNTSDEEQ